MTTKRLWPVRAMYMLVAVALAISLIISAAPALTVLASDCDDEPAEWHKVGTPTMEGFVIAPESTIVDYALASDGEVAYAVVYGYDEEWDNEGYRLLKSTDHAATWTDITEELEDLLNLDDGDYIEEMLHVATDWIDPNFVAVAVWVYWSGGPGEQLHVFISNDGGTTFVDAGQVRDGSDYLDDVSDLAVSPPGTDGKRDIAIGGMMSGPDAALFRCTVTGDAPGQWKDATDYEGWDDDGDINYSWLVTDIIFSPNWANDKTILVTTVAYDSPYTVYLQSGSWGTSPGWNAKSTLGIDAVPVKQNVNLPTFLTGFDARAIAGITLPSDYNSKVSGERLLWVWVNYYNDMGRPACEIARVENDYADAVGPLGQILNGTVWLTNVSYSGTRDSGKAIAGLLGNGTYLDGPSGLFTSGCAGVQVYRNNGINNMDICCERWTKACKPPTGDAAMAVSYVSGSKAYAVALHGSGDWDEGAWSWTFDDGDTWNQLSLIDTYISYFSDVAVSPDCNKTFLVSINEDDQEEQYCDSVWQHAVDLPEATEYSGQWIRTWNGYLVGDNEEGDDYDVFETEHGLLRLVPEETNGHTVYLVDRMSGNVYWNGLETLGCWKPVASTAVTEIVDLVAHDADTLFALDLSGKVAMYDNDEWHTAVSSGVAHGWTIAVWGDTILVGGQNGEVAISADGGETFNLAPKKTPIEGLVTVAFDSYFGQNNTIYAAVYHYTGEWEYTGGIYLWVLDESTTWMDLGAEPYAYTGIVLDNADGNPKTGPTTGGVLYASYVGFDDSDDAWFTGVARSLTPIVDIECVSCTEWDYIYVGLTGDRWDTDEGFEVMPKALKICGCLTPDSCTKIYALDWWDWYDMVEAEDGALWRFIDCYSKQGPSLRTPADGFLAPASACDCENAPFPAGWTRLCDACYYQIQFATDAAFDNIIWTEDQVLGNPVANPSVMVPGGFQPGETYYWRVRSIEANTGQVIRSWWSDARSFTVAPALGTGVYVVAPAVGAANQPRTNIAFVWDSVAVFDSYNFVLSPNADFSAAAATANGLTTKAYTYTGANLAYDTPYYWRVTAIKDGAPASVAIGTFRTMPEPVTPPPVVTPPTPFWVWVVIAIGAVLVIVVIVLIFRTRRV